MSGYLHSQDSPELTGPPDLSSPALREMVQRAIDEDLGQGDLTTRVSVPEGIRAQGTFNSKEKLVVAGLPVARLVFSLLDPKVEWQDGCVDGMEVERGTALASVTGPAESLLAGERVALNYLQHLSGIATYARRLKNLIAGTRAEFLDTRKTTPGLRMLQKYAVRTGGGRNHRLRLDDGILIKNNHLRLAGGVTAAVERARGLRPAGFLVEVEVTTLDELDQAIRAGADGALLDNMTPELVKQCVERAGGKLRLEVSGGIDAGNIRAYAETGVEFISVGVAVTHSAPAVDINFRIKPV
jgi:nicotinate-nucleotide pyrophosphorylase (carboxylating)